jgi:hypothetical protein
VAKRLGALPESLAGRVAGHASEAAAAKAMGLGLQEAGSQAQTVGHALGDVVGKPLGGLMGVGLPFHDPSLVLGTGKTGQAVANKLSGSYDWLRRTRLGQNVGAMFNPLYQGRTGADAQAVMRDNAKFADNAKAQELTNLAQTLGPGAQAGVTANGLAREAGEGWQGFRMRGPYSPELLNEAQQTGQMSRDLAEEWLRRDVEAGLPQSELESKYGTKYLPRFANKGNVTAGQSRPQQALSAAMGSLNQREKMFEIPGGTLAVEDVLTNPRLTGVKLTDRRIIRQQLGVDLARERQLRIIGTARQLTPAEQAELAQISDLRGKANDLAGYVPKLPAVNRQQGLFTNDLGTDMARRALDTVRTEGNARNVQDLLAMRPMVGATPGPGRAGAADVLKSIGLSGTIEPDFFERSQAIKAAQRAGPLSPAQQAELARLQDAERYGNLVAGKTLATRLGAQDIRGVMIPQDIVDQVKQFAPRTLNPSYVSDAVDLFDQGTTLFKGLNTAPFPGNITRNAAQDFINNLASGVGVGAAVRGPADFSKLRAGQVIPGLAKSVPAFAHMGLDDAAASRLLGSLFYGSQLGESGFSPTTVLRNHGGLLEQVPGLAKQPSVLESLSEYLPLRELAAGDVAGAKAKLNPLNLAGVGGRTETQFAPVSAMRNAQSALETNQYGGHFLERMRQGYTIPAAAAEARSALGDYGNLTDFERRVLRRAIPFYSWLKVNTPMQLGRLAQAPGGVEAQAMRLANDTRQKQGFLPEYLGGGMAAPIGDEENGTQRYLTRMDMPWEDALSLFHFGAKGGEKTAMSLLGQLNPFIKGPLEFATNRQFHSGRELDDLYSRTGLPLLDQVIMNSPIARVASTKGQLTDERKGLGAKAINLLTGMRLTDVDMNKQRDLAERDLIDEMLRGDQNVGRYEKFYVRPDQMANLTPQEIALMQMYRNVEKRQEERAKKAKLLPAS